MFVVCGCWPAHKTFSGYLLPSPIPTSRCCCQLLAIPPRTPPACSYYRNRICQIEVEMLSAFPCHLASVYRLIVCLPVCLFVRTPPAPPHTLLPIHLPFWQLHSLLVSVLATVSVSAIRFRTAIRFRFRFRAWSFVLAIPCSFAVYLIVCLFGEPTLINCRFYWHFGFDVVVY